MYAPLQLQSKSTSEPGLRSAKKSVAPKVAPPQPISQAAFDMANIPIYPPIRPKLAISAHSDRSEQEADHMAYRVMTMPEPRLQLEVEEDGESATHSVIAPDLVQRQADDMQIFGYGYRMLKEDGRSTWCSHNNRLDPDKACDGARKYSSVPNNISFLRNGRCKDVEGFAGHKFLFKYKTEPPVEENRGVPCPEKESPNPISAKLQPGTIPHESPAVVTSISAMRGGGTPLINSTRAFMEPRFGRDFSDVRIHTDHRAADTAQSINARAFTVGRNIAFGAGQYAPDSQGGRRLLAHELAHVVQGGKGCKASKELQPVQARNLPEISLQTKHSEIVREPRSLSQSLIISLLSNYERSEEIDLIEKWIKAFPHHSASTNLKKVLVQLKMKLCGPDVTDWLKRQMSNNGKSDIVKEMRESNKKAWVGDHSVWAQKQWYNLVKTGGPWDFKTILGKKISSLKPCRSFCLGKLYSITLDNQCMTYEVPANVHYAFVGRFAGFTEKKLLGGAATAQVGEGRGEAGDDPRDVQSIKKGFELYNSGSPAGLSKSGLKANYYENLGSIDGDPAGCNACSVKYS